MGTINEFLERAKTKLAKGADKDQWGFATMLGEACEIIGVQQNLVRELVKTAQIFMLQAEMMGIYTPAHDEFIAKAEELLK